MGSKKKSNSGKKNVSVKNPQACVFCQQTTLDEVIFGELKSTKNFRAHYYCLLLSATIKQSGQDNQGILGFMHMDILKELRQTKHKQCCYCKEFGANLNCTYNFCNRNFHLPCGFKNNTQHNFSNFTSLCHQHRKVTNVPVYIKKSLSDYKCLICLESFDASDNVSNIIWASCCKSDVVLHLRCIQELALSAGYFTKCPGCNNKSEFIATIKVLGVFVPERDASWELERNAFSELLYVHSTCDAANCICPEGRNYATARGEWKLMLCKLCGSSGTHVNCSTVKREFVCGVCKIDTSLASTSVSTLSGECAVTSQTVADDANKSTTNFEETVDVDGIEILEDSPSFKLSDSSTSDIPEIDSINNQKSIQHEKCNEKEAVENDKQMINLPDGFTVPSHSAEETDIHPLKGGESDMFLNNTSIDRCTSAFPVPVISPVKRKLADIENVTTECVAKKIKKSSDFDTVHLKHTSLLVESFTKESTSCNLDAGEPSTKPRNEICSTRLGNLINFVQNVVEQNIVSCSVNEDSNCTKNVQSVEETHINHQNDESIPQCASECSTEAELINEEIFPAYKISLDTNSEIEFISCPDLNVTTQNCSDLAVKDGNERMHTGLLSNSVVNSDRIIEEDGQVSFENSIETTQNIVNLTSVVSENKIQKSVKPLTEKRRIQPSYISKHHRKGKRIIKINFRNQTAYAKIPFQSYTNYKWNFKLLQRRDKLLKNKFSLYKT